MKAIATFLEERLGCRVGERTVYRWMRVNNLPYRKAGGWIIAKKDDLDAWLENEPPPM